MIPTEEQKNIFNFIKTGKGHGIIDAVAGAGKTTTIIRCAEFIEDKHSILFCAFNNNIAGEIAKKFHRTGISEVTVKTIHSLGRQILQDNNSTGNPIKLEDEKFRKLLQDSSIKEQLRPHVENILKINGLAEGSIDDNKNYAVADQIRKINTRLLDINQKYRATLCKNNLKDIEELVAHFNIFNDTEIRKKNYSLEIKEYFSCHQILLEAGNNLSRRTMIIDYTDMLYLPFEWKQYPVKKFGFLFIDECQDLSKSQFAIVAKYGKKDCRILAVGDPHQSIYGFTGADINSFNRIKEYTQAEPLPLTTCFRCPKTVITLAQMIRPDMQGNKTAEGAVISIPLEEVLKMAKPGDLIISRLRSPMLLLVFTFIDKNIRVQIHEDEIREVISELKFVFKQNELSMIISSYSGGFERLKIDVLNRRNWIIEKDAERIVDAAERALYILQEKEFLKKKLEFLHRKYELWKSECNSINDILQKVKEFISAPINAVKLSTIHRAKGLENERVFILNYDELPYYRLQQKDWERVQELNLKYVAVTRSLNELYLIESKKTDTIEEEESLFDIFPF